MDSFMDTWGFLMWVSPFRYLRIMAYLQLPEAFRSLSRLSSALSAKASALRSYSLNQAFRYFFQYLEYSRLAYRLYTSSLICLQISFFRCLFQVFSFQSTMSLWPLSELLSNLSIQWRRRESNSWPPACKAGALPAELRPHFNPATTYFPMPSPA